MLTVKKANVILAIEDDELDKYFEKGYSVLDEFGNVVKASVPTEVGALQKAYQDLEAIIAQQNQQIEALKKENETLVAKLNKPMEDPVEEAPKKKSTYKRKTQD